MAVKIDGKVVLVTGSNRGIGRALVDAALERGAKKVYATARNVSTLGELSAKYGDRVELVALDVTDASQLAEVAAQASDIEVLINNAGVAVGGDISAIDTLAAARLEMEVNYFGLLAATSAFTGALSKAGGVVANVVSVGGLTNFPFFPTYSASKAAAHSLTQAQRMLLAAHGIQVSGVYPGPVDTDMAKGIEMDKATPRSVADKILDGIEAGDEDIYPDGFAAQFGEQFAKSPKESERGIAGMLATA